MAANARDGAIAGRRDHLAVLDGSDLRKPQNHEMEHLQPVTRLVDSGFDDVSVWDPIWGQVQHLVCRVTHRNQ